ncbi:unnamed protein product [Larinioides sclopetarius]|uniref:Uncharacterized protein n=1 Tax=Larinioides sclopetarius TaxID=280406 RepID=A0AAV2B5G2_9ARAC
MFFLVCFHCFQVCTYEEGHHCPFNERNEDDKNSANVIMIRAEPANLRKDSTTTAREKIVQKAENKNDQRFRKRKRSTDVFMFSIVTDDSGSKTIDMECRTINNDVCGINKTPRNENVDNFHMREAEPRNGAAGFHMPPVFPENIAHYSHQSTQHESIKNVLVQDAHNVDYPARLMEFRTINNDVCDMKEAPRNKNSDNIHRQGPEPRNVAAGFYMPPEFSEHITHYSSQSTQHKSNKNASIQGTHTVYNPAVNMEYRMLNNDICGINETPQNENFCYFHPRVSEPRNAAAGFYTKPAFPDDAVHYSRQSTQYESINGTHTIDNPAFCMEYRTTNNDACGINEVPRNETIFQQFMNQIIDRANLLRCQWQYERLCSWYATRRILGTSHIGENFHV